MASPPGYIGVGVLGAATAWWHGLLLRHPRVRGPVGRRRELGFFTEFCLREMTEADVAAYHARFRAGPGEVAGEWTPGYLHEPWTPVLLRRAAPDARLLVLLRDPVEQYRDRIAEARRALGEEEAYQFVVDAIGRLRHATQLRALRDAVGPERILVLQQEQCVRDPAGEYRRTLRFLGVADDVVPDRVHAPPRPPRSLRAALA
ncbi:MAG TPA: sulfotransferase, partial [Solirubrobacteraceae bacterium]|nr:sulfotransferase [Solirubrobacteraceae bacterium]